jgi:hypothetical protein
MKKCGIRDSEALAKKMIIYLTIEPIAKVVIPVQTGIQKFLQHIEKTG